MLFTLLADTIHCIVNLKDHVQLSRKLTAERYYYTDAELFEQSIDIYRPLSLELPSHNELTSKNVKQQRTHTKSKPVVALVVGSAWLGHHPFIYHQTSWWNSSGPKAVAKLGYVCVCIRHRGGFPKVASFLNNMLRGVLTNVILMHFIVGVIISILIGSMAICFVCTNNGEWKEYYEDDGFLSNLQQIQSAAFAQLASSAAIYAAPMATSVMFFFTSLMLMEIIGKNSASFDDMQSDVMDALAWYEKNKEMLGLNGREKETSAILSSGRHANLLKPTKTKTPFIFGGYSSGGHVAATITQNQQLWKDRNLPPCHEYCSAILYVSPVLSTRPCYDNENVLKLLNKQLTVNGSTAQSLSSLSTSSLSFRSSPSLASASTPSLASIEESMTALQPSPSVKKEQTRVILSSPCSSRLSFTSPSSPLASQSPTWLTDQIIKLVFGPNAMHTLPSPIEAYHKSPPIPHIFLGCKNEVPLKLNWLNLFFSSEIYSLLLQKHDTFADRGIESRYCEIESSDHWNVLDSREFYCVLGKELERAVYF